MVDYRNFGTGLFFNGSRTIISYFDLLSFINGKGSRMNWDWLIPLILKMVIGLGRSDILCKRTPKKYPNFSNQLSISYPIGFSSLDLF